MTSPGRCQMAGCKPAKDDPPKAYPGEGTYCGRHARVMIHRSRWEALSVPFPAGQEPPPADPVRPARYAAPKLRTLGWPPVADPVDVVYGPCPRKCGRTACWLPDQDPQPCMACQVAEGTPMGAGPCAVALDPVVTAAGFTTHPCCDPAELAPARKEPP